jgi:hypothetical protein
VRPIDWLVWAGCLWCVRSSLRQSRAMRIWAVVLTAHYAAYPWLGQIEPALSYGLIFSLVLWVLYECYGLWISYGLYRRSR